jgi:putative phosphoesterase
VKATATLPMPPDGTLRLAVVADTHSQPHAEAARHLRAVAPAAILHAGDIGDPAVLAALGKIAPVHAIRGNIDAQGLPDVLVLDIGNRLRILLVHIAVAGPRLHANVARDAKAERAQMVVCGHSHVPFIGEDRGLTVFNPGSIGPRRFQLPIVFGTIDIAPTGIRLAHVDCETGARWLPP